MINLREIQQAKTLAEVSSYLQTVVWRGRSVDRNTETAEYAAVIEALRRLRSTSSVEAQQTFLTSLEKMEFTYYERVVEQLLDTPPSPQPISYSEGQAILALKILSPSECIVFQANKKGNRVVGFSDRSMFSLAQEYSFNRKIFGYTVRIITLQQAEEEYFSRRISQVAVSKLASREATISKDDQKYTLTLRNQIFFFKIAYTGLIEETNSKGEILFTGRRFESVQALETQLGITHWHHLSAE